MKLLFISLLIIFSSIAQAAEEKWAYKSKDNSLSATIRPDSSKLVYFELECRKANKGVIELNVVTRLAPTTPRKGKEGVTPVTLDIDGIVTKFRMINHAFYPELITSDNSIPKSILNQIANGKELLFFWERWTGRLELEIISLKNSSKAINKLQIECQKF